MTPPVMIAKPASGVLPIPAAQMQPSGPNVKASAPQTRSKVVIRRLAPGLTHQELQDALGDDWAPGKGRVDWMLFRPGKVSRDLSKPSKPARVYLQISNQTHLEILAEKVRSTPFTDARNTAGDTVLIGPPTLDFAPYGRVPANKRRNDARQGLIDQDPEFIQFLESLTNPITKSAAADTNTETSERKDVNITVTPLIQHLRDKKAAKEAAKEKSSAAKAAKHTRQSSKTENVEVKGDLEAPSPIVKDAVKSPEKKQGRASKAERATKIATRPAKSESVAVETKTQPAPRSSSQITKVAPEVIKPAADTPSPAKKSESVNPGAAAARMLQRDLGIRGGKGGTSRRGGVKQGAEQTPAATAAVTTATQTSSAERVTNAAPQATKSSTAGALTSSITATTVSPTDLSVQSPTANKNPIAPAIMKRTAPNRPLPAAGTKSNNKPAVASASSSTVIINAPTIHPISVNPPTASSIVQPAAPVLPTPHLQPKPILSTSTSTKAFLKHANPSQGITEPLLLTALSVFGPVTSVEIDKRKGFAYVEFSDPEGLKKAIAAGSVKVAQGSVQVLERKDRVSSTPAAARSGANPTPNAGAAAVASQGGDTGPSVGSGIGVGRGASPARGGGSVPARSGQGGSGQHTHQQQQQQPGQQQQQPYRGGRGGGRRGRGGTTRAGIGSSTTTAVAEPLSATVSNVANSTTTPTTATATEAAAVAATSKQTDPVLSPIHKTSGSTPMSDVSIPAPSQSPLSAFKIPSDEASEPVPVAVSK